MKSIENSDPTVKGRRANRRRKYVINSAFQWRYAIWTSAVVLIVTSLLSFVLYGLLHQQARLRMAHPETYTAEVTMVIFVFALGFSLVTAAGIGLWSFIATHRICGPLYVLEGLLLEITKGHLPQIRPLRKKDEFKELYAIFSNAVGSLRTSRQADLALLTRALETARSAIESDDDTCRKALESLAGEIESLRESALHALGCENDEVPTPRPPKPRVPCSTAAG